ncbi:MAG: VTT domain-containing protein [Gammaproteobacteria bacterium]|nr:VTT domain-containing protein [Gammaproteobacteria bacterium]
MRSVLVNIAKKPSACWFAMRYPWVLLSVLVIALLLMIVAAFIDSNNLDSALAATERWLAVNRNWGIFAFILISTVAMTMVIPEAIFGIAAGSLYGFVWGSILLCVSGLLCATLVFFIARGFMHGPVQNWLSTHPRLRALEGVVDEGGLRVLCLLRLLPVNPAIMSYAMAMTRVQLWPYLLASCCMTPAWILTVYFGCVATDVVKVVGGASEFVPLRDTLVATSLVFSIAVMVYVTRLAARHYGLEQARASRTNSA